MEDDLESQLEEEEALLAIYDGDPFFKRLSPTVFQYKCGENEANSILVEISWPKSYPSEKPIINLNSFYNNHVPQPVKDFIFDKINEKAEQYLDVAMTYTLIEYVKDNLAVWLTKVSTLQPPPVSKIEDTLPDISDMHISEITKKVEKKEQLSKAQKRRQWNRCDMHGERPRGYNWVDVVKHLSQTGPQSESSTANS